MRRMLSVWLPSWPILRRRRMLPQSDKTLATVRTVGGLRRLEAVCSRAAALGLRPDQPLTEARAICPQLDAHDADPGGDRVALGGLATWCERFTPLATADPPDGLWLDVTGCTHLFGGEDRLLATLSARLARDGLPVRLALAGTAGAAWALARSPTGREMTILPPGQERAALGKLPVALLRLDPRTVAGLRRLGLKSIGELARLPRGELSGRFGPAPVLRLDQAFGDTTEAIVWPHPPAPWSERLAFVEPIATPDDLARALALLAQRLCTRLANDHQGARSFTASFFRVDDLRPAIAIATSLPARDPVRVARLLGEKLDTVDPGFGVEAIALDADDISRLPPPQARLGDLAARQAGNLADSVDELANRLGPHRLWRAAPHGSHLPERGTAAAAPLTRPAWPDDGPERPIRLFARPEPIDAIAPVPDDPPVQFRWRRHVHRVRTAAGPERIAAEWWRKDEPERDYYRVEDTAGARFWLYRRDHGAAARWFVHGVFG